MKTSKQCPKCQSVDVLYITNPLPSATRHSHLAWQPQRPLPVGIGYGDMYQPRVEECVGPLEGYCCASCGYFETYLKAPVTVDGVYIKRLNQPPTGYR